MGMRRIGMSSWPLRLRRGVKICTLEVFGVVTRQLRSSFSVYVWIMTNVIV